MVVDLQNEIRSFLPLKTHQIMILQTKEREDKGSLATRSSQSGSSEVAKSMEQCHEYVGLGFERRGMRKVFRMWNNFDTLSI